MGRPFRMWLTWAVPTILQTLRRGGVTFDATDFPICVLLRSRRQARFCVICVAVSSARGEDSAESGTFAKTVEIGSIGVWVPSARREAGLLTPLQIIHESNTSLAIRSTRRRQ